MKIKEYLPRPIMILSIIMIIIGFELFSLSFSLKSIMGYLFLTGGIFLHSRSAQ